MSRRTEQLNRIEASLARLEDALPGHAAALAALAGQAGHVAALREETTALRAEVQAVKVSADSAHAGVRALADMLPAWDFPPPGGTCCLRRARSEPGGRSACGPGSGAFRCSLRRAAARHRLPPPAARRAPKASKAKGGTAPAGELPPRGARLLPGRAVPVPSVIPQRYEEHVPLDRLTPHPANPNAACDVRPQHPSCWTPTGSGGLAVLACRRAPGC